MRPRRAVETPYLAPMATDREKRGRVSVRDPKSTDGDRRLVDRYLESRDDEAFRFLYREHTDYLFGVALRLTGGSEVDASDLVQKTWITVAEILDRFRWESQLRTWLAGILLNTYRQFRRDRHRRERRVSSLEERERAGRSISSGRGIPDTVDRIALERELARLADGYREVVVLFHVYGYSHREISEFLGISEGTSRSQLTRGLARLREQLG